MKLDHVELVYMGLEPSRTHLEKTIRMPGTRLDETGTRVYETGTI